MKTNILAVLTAAVALAATGCAVDAKKEVATYRRVLDADAPAEPVVYHPDEPLSLQRALILANQSNERLAIGGEDYLQAIIDRKRVIADFLPTLTFAPNYFLRQKSNFDAKLSTDRHFDAPLEVGFGPFNAPRSLANLKTSELTIEERYQLLLDLKSSVLLDAAVVYYQVLRSERQVQVLTNSLEVQDERVRDVEAQRDAGTARPLDVAQARAQAASTRADLTQAKGNVRNSRYLLAFLIATPAVDGPLVDEFQLPADIPDRSALETRALEHRRDVLAARAGVQAARHAVDAAFAQYYPSVSLNLDYFVYRESVPAESLYTALFQANIPIFRAGRIHADVRTAWSQFRQAKERESLALRQARQDVQSTYENLLTSRSRLRDLEANVSSAQEALDQATDLFRFGRATNLERLVAQDQLLTAQLAMTNEQFNEKVAYLRLRRATEDLSLSLTAPAAPPGTPVTR